MYVVRLISNCHFKPTVMYMYIMLGVCVLQNLAHRTLCTLMNADPSQFAPDVPLPATLPNVTFAYIKYLWHSGKRVSY